MPETVEDEGVDPVEQVGFVVGADVVRPEGRHLGDRLLTHGRVLAMLEEHADAVAVVLECPGERAGVDALEEPALDDRVDLVEHAKPREVAREMRGPIGLGAELGGPTDGAIAVARRLDIVTSWKPSCLGAGAVGKIVGVMGGRKRVNRRRDLPGGWSWTE